jgi:hypothetical protein
VIVEAGHAKARHALVDSGAHARTGYAVHGETLILVRPDGYIGWIASPGTADGLDDYLRRAGAVPAAPSTAS